MFPFGALGPWFTGWHPRLRCLFHFGTSGSLAMAICFRLMFCVLDSRLGCHMGLEGCLVDCGCGALGGCVLPQYMKDNRFAIPKNETGILPPNLPVQIPAV